MSRVALLVSVALWSCGGARLVADPGPVERLSAAGELLSFDASGSAGPITEYRWSFGDDTPDQTGAQVTHEYATNGTFTVTLTVKNATAFDSATVLVTVGKGCNASAVLKVVTQAPAPGVPTRFSSAGSSGCAGAALVSYEWDFGDGAHDSGATASATEHTYATAGTYSVTLTVRDTRGAEGHASRELGVGVSTEHVSLSCAQTRSAEVGLPITLSASGSDTAGHSLTYAWTFSDGSAAALGASVAKTFTTPGSVTATVIATTDDSRSSAPCETVVTVTPAADYSGSWVLNPGSASLAGCSMWTTGFPAAQLALVHSGDSMSATPSGNGWPASSTLSGHQDAPPTPRGTFRVTGSTSDEAHAGCGQVTPEHSVRLTFTTPTTVQGTWTIVYTAACVGAGCAATCNCVASGDFTGAKH